MTSVRRALTYTFASNYTAQIIGFVSILVLSRLLSPEEIGIYSVAAVLLLITDSLRSYGVTAYIVSAPVLDQESLRKANGVVAIMTLLICLTLYLGAPAFAGFYGEPGLADIVRIVAVGFLLTPLITIPSGVYVRRMEFHKIMWLRITSAAVQAGVSVSLAAAGWSYLSVAVGLAISSVVQFVLTNRFRSADIPWGLQLRGIGEIFAFGSYSGLSNLFKSTADGIGDLVIGKMSSMTNVGIFSRGMGLVLIFNRAVTLAVQSVVLPHLANEFREQGTIKPAYLRAVEYHTGLAWPFFAVLLVTALPVVRLLYGDQWDAAAPIAALLSIWGAVQALFCYAGPALVAVRRIELTALKELAALLIRGTAVVVGLSLGDLHTVSLILIAGAVAELLITGLLLERGARIPMREQLSACTRSLTLGIIVLAAAWLTRELCSRYLDHELLSLALCVTAGGCGWLAGSWLVRHPLLGELKQLISRLRVQAAT